MSSFLRACFSRNYTHLLTVGFIADKNIFPRVNQGFLIKTWQHNLEQLLAELDSLVSFEYLNEDISGRASGVETAAKMRFGQNCRYILQGIFRGGYLFKYVSAGGKEKNKRIVEIHIGLWESKRKNRNRHLEHQYLFRAIVSGEFGFGFCGLFYLFFPNSLRKQGLLVLTGNAASLFSPSGHCTHNNLWNDSYFQANLKYTYIPMRSVETGS